MENLAVQLEAERQRMAQSGPGYGCKARAERLVACLRGLDHEHIMYATIRPVPPDEGQEAKLYCRRASIRWAEHIVCADAGVEPPLVHDPVLPESLPLDAYLQEMFGDQPVTVELSDTKP